MIYRLLLVILICLFSFTITYADGRTIPSKQDHKQTSLQEDNTTDFIRVIFYNVENLFDTKNDSLVADAEYSPEGNRHWDKIKYEAKLLNIYKVIMAVGGGHLPDLIGLCEIENRGCLEDLIEQTPLDKLGYKIIHYESPDRRGIDVALLYRETNFSTLESEAIKVSYPKEIGRGATRDILYVKGLLFNSDTIHLYVNHWPSKYGGVKKTDPKRAYLGQLLKKNTDSILKNNNQSHILIMGDLNDEPDDASVKMELGAKTKIENINPKSLYNLTYPLQYEKKEWSHKYRSHTGIIDQIIVSGNLLKGNRVQTSLDKVHIFKADFLLEKDEKYLGVKPFRTYIGMKYNRGFSDHLPVYIDLFLK